MSNRYGSGRRQLLGDVRGRSEAADQDFFVRVPCSSRAQTWCPVFLPKRGRYVAGSGRAVSVLGGKDSDELAGVTVIIEV